MKFAEISQKTDTELQSLLADRRKEVGQARIDLRTKQVSNVKQIIAHKKIIARVLTIQRQRALTKEEANG